MEQSHNILDLYLIDYEQVPGSEGGQDWPAQQQRPGPPPHPLGQQVRSAGKKARQIQKARQISKQSICEKACQI